MTSSEVLNLLFISFSVSHLKNYKREFKRIRMNFIEVKKAIIGRFNQLNFSRTSKASNLRTSSKILMTATAAG